jgi:hypothetical protein
VWNKSSDRRALGLARAFVSSTQRGRRGCSLSGGASGALASFAGGHSRDESSDAEVLDERLENLVAVNLDVLELDLRLLGDEVHLSFSLLL